MFEEGIFANGVFRGPYDQLLKTPFGWARIEDEYTENGFKYVTARLEQTKELAVWSSESSKWRTVEE